MHDQPVLPTNHTFVVCAYGESPYLEACVRSVVNQTEKTNVIMSTSTMNEHIRSIADQYQLPLYLNPGEGGMQDNWNFGVSCAKTDFVTVCHQDDYYHPDYFQSIRPFLSDDMLLLHTSYLDVLEGREFRNFNNQMRLVLNFPLRSRYLQRVCLAKKNALRFGNSICCPSCTYHVSLLGQPVFVSKLRHSCDWDIYINMAEQKGAMVYLPQTLCYKRTHAASATAGDIRTGIREREDKYLFERLWPSPIAHMMLAIYKKIYKYSA